MESWKRYSNARSLLFVPGHAPDRFSKAALSGADGVVLDLEDAVAQDRKNEARHNVLDWFARGGSGIVRINGTSSPWFEDDVAALSKQPHLIMLPKVARPDEVSDLLIRLPPGSQVMPLLESASGILNAREICSTTGVLRAVFGNADLARELGIDMSDRRALSFARSKVVMASAAAQITPPIDGVTANVADDGSLLADTAHSIELGFSGKLCIHPRQVKPVNDAFLPSDEELSWARDVIATANKNGGSIGLLDGKVVGTPIIEQAHRLIARAGQFSAPGPRRAGETAAPGRG